MNRVLIGVALIAGLSGCPSAANFNMESTFQQKLAAADLVLIGTATAVHREGPYGRDTTATFTIIQTLKGASDSTVIVATWFPIAEMREVCCDIGATYLMFLQHPRVSANSTRLAPRGPLVLSGDHIPRPGELLPVQGGYSLVRIGGPPFEVRTVPAEPLEIRH